MQCLWRWATAKAEDSSEPVTLRRVRGLGCADLGPQVGEHCQPQLGSLAPWDTQS